MSQPEQNLRARRPTWAEIDLNNLAANFNQIKQRVSPTARVMAVVKADAYGHGAVECARRLAREGADWFGVALPEEGIELREAGITQPILCLAGYWPGPANPARPEPRPPSDHPARLEGCTRHYGRGATPLTLPSPPSTGEREECAPNDAQLYLARATLYAADGRNREALTDREAAVSLLPKSPEALLARGGSYHALGMHAQGLADRSEAIRLDPALAEAWCARGSAYFLLGEFEKAASDLERAVQLKPGYQEASEVLAKTRVALTPPPTVVTEETPVEVAEETAPVPAALPEPKPVPAATAPRQADPKSAALHNQRGRELMYQGHYQQAVDELTAAIEAQPDLALAYNARGFTYYLMHDTAHALADFDEAIRLNPAYTNALHNRSLALSAKK